MGHPSKDIKGRKGGELKEKRIVLAITGSASAYKAPDIARELMRHGAEVYAVMTRAAQRIIHPNIMEWATGNPVVTELTGKIEHVAFTTGEGKADLILVAPATANTISKIAAGIDDTPVTSFISSALGAKIPILMAPAMHDTMMANPFVMESVRRLEGAGVKFIKPVFEEGKAKLAEVEEIAEAVISELSPKPFKGLSFLVTGGPTVEPIDPIRVITNRSSGRMAVAIAKAASRMGAGVTLVYGPGHAEPPSGVRTVRVGTAEEMYRAVMGELESRGYDVMISAAAAADYAPAARAGVKIPTAEVPSFTLELKATPKIIDAVKKVSPKTFLVAFKAEHGLSEDELVARALERLRSSRADLVVANDVGRPGIGFGSEENEVYIVGPEGLVAHVPRMRKERVAEEILKVIAERVRGGGA